jgi:hypothetical protein
MTQSKDLPEAPEESISTPSDLEQSNLSKLMVSMDGSDVLVNREQQKHIMSVLTLMQAGHLMDIFKIMQQTTEFCRRSFQLLYNPDLVYGDLKEDPKELKERLFAATAFMQKYMNYAQKFTIGNQTILAESPLKEKEKAVVRYLSELSEDQLNDLVQYLEGLSASK